MRYAKNSLTFGLLVAFALSAQLHAQESAPPAPPAVEGVAETAIEPVSTEPLPLPAEVSSNCSAVATSCDTTGSCDGSSGCEFTPGATCCNTDCYRCCCCGHPCCYMPGIHHRTRRGKLRWCRVWTTGDMYQHYAYYPANHGYHYFRPYNYTNVLEHKATVGCLGGEPNHPYSVAMFAPSYESYYLTNPKLVDTALSLDMIPGASLLPNLEKLLVE